MSGYLCPMKAENEQSAGDRRAGLLFNIACSYEQSCEFVSKMFCGFDGGGGKLMGFGKTLGYVSLENIVACNSAILSSFSLFFSASSHLNAKYISSRFISLLTTSSCFFNVAAAIFFIPLASPCWFLVSETLPLFSFCAVQQLVSLSAFLLHWLVVIYFSFLHFPQTS